MFVHARMSAFMCVRVCESTVGPLLCVLACACAIAGSLESLQINVILEGTSHDELRSNTSSTASSTVDCTCELGCVCVR